MSMVFNVARKKKKAISEDVLYFIAPDSFSVILGNSSNGNTWDGTIQTSLDGHEWTEYIAGDEITSNVENGNRVYFRGNSNTYISASDASYSTFILTGNNISCYGNIMVLLDTNVSTTINHEYCFNNLFKNCTSLTLAPALPATTLDSYCYYHMFQNCTSLTSAPALPATTLAEGCYSLMFYGCTGLTSAPDLPATTLAGDCYSAMFYNCTGLTSAPNLSATTLASNCYLQMLRNCISLTSAPALPATTLARSCYSQMFHSCTGLTSAPELPATTLASHCYDYMFKGCTSLTSAPALPATTLAEGCYNLMFENCTGLTSIPALPAATLYSYCYQGMFSGCAGLTIKAVSDNSNIVPWRIPYNASDSVNNSSSYPVRSMFKNTQSDNITEPELNTIYYTSAVVLPDGTLVTS